MGYEKPLRVVGRRHDIIGIHLYDPREETLPNIGLVRAVDPETGLIAWLDTGSRKVRDNYARWYQKNYDYFKSIFVKSGADSLSIRTDESYVHALLKFFQRRQG